MEKEITGGQTKKNIPGPTAPRSFSELYGIVVVKIQFEGKAGVDMFNANNMRSRQAYLEQSAIK